MIESTIRDIKKDVNDNLERINSCLIEIDDSELKEKLNEVRTMIKRKNPSLMFYGIYNSGKSTLLNAIFGEDLATTNDIPETHRVTKYEWGNFVLVDTPGINAPVEGDEEITINEIVKHDIIMFVIEDCDNFDSEEITKKICEILATKKPSIIVINKKNNSNQEDIITIKAKMNQNICKFLPNAPSYDFITVDAKTALKAKKENKKLLLQESNILEFESCISKKMYSLDSIMMLRVPLENLQLICQNASNKVRNEEKAETLIRMNELLEEISHVKNNAIMDFHIKLKNKISFYKESIYNQMSNGEKGEIDKEKCENDICLLVNECLIKYCEAINAKSDELLDKWRIEIRVKEVEKESIKREKGQSKDDIDELLDTLEKIPILIPVPLPEPIPIPLPVIIALLKGLKKIIFGSGNNDKNVDEINDKNEEAARKRMYALKELKNNINVQLDDYAKNIEQTFLEKVSIQYDVKKNEYEKVINELKNCANNNMELLSNIQNIENNIAILLNEIS